ncbi:MAG: formate--tetrahydrofolate ligase [Atopococcus tabaci]|uniref:Formate--tetrahydrofolate ligase n=1 Tax=Atopococcus tabaci TaxID=269774 RepID=A0AA43ZSN6_9LACT|nr:formate--tetrahydrofolate ligase [Atopococcus tabaci]
MATDIEIAQQAKMQPIEDIAAKLDITPDQMERYGDYIAKIDYSKVETEANKGKLVLVTAITPTPAGEGKTTTSIGLADGLTKIGKKAAVAIREPSLGPVFGVKGGAAGGGYAQVVPMENINLHFTGDIHAITAANNLIAAMMDASIHNGNPTNLDPRRVEWRRAIDMNDRQLRNMVNGIGNRADGVPREDGFDITAASEVMAVLCLAEGVDDLKERIGRIILGYTYENEPVTVSEIKAEGAVASLLRDALKPNLVQTLEGTPVFVHGGPFANIAHGTNTTIATKMSMSNADYTITEAGFGADLGAEKYMDIVSRFADFEPDAVVVVATIRALKMHGGKELDELKDEDVDAVRAGLPNLVRHIENMQDTFGMNVVVAINTFPTDTEAEVEALREEVADRGVNVVQATHFSDGGAGATDLAEEVVRLCDEPSTIKYAYDLEDSLFDKVEKIVKNVYRGDGVEFSTKARRKLQQYEDLGYGNMPVCVAKTQMSFTDDAKRKGAPEGFEIAIDDASISAGAGFIVVQSGSIMKMPGLGKTPAATKIDVANDGTISGLF